MSVAVLSGFLLLTLLLRSVTFVLVLFPAWVESDTMEALVPRDENGRSGVELELKLENSVFKTKSVLSERLSEKKPNRANVKSVASTWFGSA